MIAPDSSVVLAALSPWHMTHVAAREALTDAKPKLIIHVAFETTSALSRMPEGRRVSAAVVLEALKRAFPAPWLGLDPAEARSALERAVNSGVRGGALYDALIAATAARHDLPVISADKRARTTYEAMGVEAHYVTS